MPDTVLVSAVRRRHAFRVIVGKRTLGRQRAFADPNVSHANRVMTRHRPARLLRLREVRSTRRRDPRHARAGRSPPAEVASPNDMAWSLRGSVGSFHQRRAAVRVRGKARGREQRPRRGGLPTPAGVGGITNETTVITAPSISDPPLARKDRASAQAPSRTRRGRLVRTGGARSPEGHRRPLRTARGCFRRARRPGTSPADAGCRPRFARLAARGRQQPGG